MATLTYDINQVVLFARKHPDATRALTVNMADQDGTTNDAGATDTGFLQSRTISSISVSTPSGITLDSNSNTTLAFTLNVSAGTDQAEPYDFDVDVTLSTGEVEPVIVRFFVRKPNT